MVFSRGSITAVEFGTTKVCALHGGRDRNGNPVVYGFGERPCEGAMCKGDIVDFSALVNALAKALEDADKSAGSDYDRGSVFCVVSGAGVSSRQGEGEVFIYDEDRKVRDEHIQEAVAKAQNLSLAPDQIPLNAFDSYFMLDGRRRVKNPLDQTATKLNAFIHMIFSERNRIDNFRSALKEFGFEGEITPVFGAVASAYGVLTRDEKEQGVLLADIGGGLTDYLLVQDDGVLLSGVVPVGIENVANDLAIGLDLNIAQCRKILSDGRLQGIRSEGGAFVELTGSVAGTTRKIPLSSFEKIIELRLRELFSIIKADVDAKGLGRLLGAGAVLTGGGACLPEVQEMFKDVFGVHVRVGEPGGFSGAVTGLDNPRHTSILGLLKYAADLDSSGHASGLTGGFMKVTDALDGVTKTIFKKLKNATGSLKI
jgi:cell division protein FtsA